MSWIKCSKFGGTKWVNLDHVRMAKLEKDGETISLFREGYCMGTADLADFERAIGDRSGVVRQ